MPVPQAKASVQAHASVQTQASVRTCAGVYTRASVQAPTRMQAQARGMLIYLAPPFLRLIVLSVQEIAAAARSLYARFCDNEKLEA
ncbi:hypothetical protein BD779DRAFT_1571536 [Infundibulicybe gibba]|nr:hypothetical protein BD779DRAFT_1571536 [Infundibulicybe gibba]